MGNKVKYNLKNVHAAKMTETVTDGVASFTYAKPKAIPGAVSISLDAEGESSPFYADGIVYFRSVTNNGYSGDLEIALIPEWFRTEILQETLDDKGVLVENSGVGESVKFALLFEFDGISMRSAMCCITARPPARLSNQRQKRIPLSQARKRCPLRLTHAVTGLSKQGREIPRIRRLMTTGIKMCM